jgi:N-sulfoglucosamine sulfohydrolase
VVKSDLGTEVRQSYAAPAPALWRLSFVTLRPMRPTLTRKQFLATGAGILGSSAGAIAQRRARPNILFAIADDQSWLHTSSAGDPVVKTPTIDRIAGRGVRFTNSFCSSPSCTPSRGSILTGRNFWELEEGGNLWSSLPKKFDVYPDLLEAAGYHVGLHGKGWGPGDFKAGGFTRNPAGTPYTSFASFLEARPKDKPFCFWFGSTDPHRPYEPGSGARSGVNVDKVAVPPWLPDTREVREDISDYLFEVQRFDRDVGAIVDAIQKAGGLDNTLVVITSDNGMPFPRAKTNLYDSGTHMPLAMSWPAAFRGGRVVDDFVSHADFAPTFLEAAGLAIPRSMSGRSLLPLLSSNKSGQVERERDRVFTGRERHTAMRAGAVGYPMRAAQTREYLYIRNYEPDRWPSGDPPHYSDIDNGPSKEFVLTHKDSPEYGKFFEMACAKRPAEELYDLGSDPAQQKNVASDRQYAGAKAKMSAMLRDYLTRTKDPRATGAPVIWDTSPYYGGRNPQARKPPK